MIPLPKPPVVVFVIIFLLTPPRLPNTMRVPLPDPAKVTLLGMDIVLEVV